MNRMLSLGAKLANATFAYHRRRGHRYALRQHARERRQGLGRRRLVRGHVLRPGDRRPARHLRPFAPERGGRMGFEGRQAGPFAPVVMVSHVERRTRVYVFVSVEMM